MGSPASALQLENVLYDKKGLHCLCNDQPAKGNECAEPGDDCRVKSGL